MGAGKILDNHRIRQTHQSFGYVPHKFLKEGFLSALKKREAHLYLFYILAADRYGMSYYGDRHICKLLSFSLEELRSTRDGLIHKNLISIEDALCQVLELPLKPIVDRIKSSSNGSFSALNRRIQR